MRYELSLFSNFDRYELDTILVEIESIINSRPISMNPEKYGDAPVLRPVDLIIPSIRLSIPYDYEAHINQEQGKTPTTEDVTRNYISSFNEQVEEIWKLWSSLYLTNLKEASHKNKNYSKTAPQVGQVVLVSNEDLPRHSWPLGRIVKIHESPDGQERTATLKCKNRIIKRSLCHLIPLEVIHEDTRVESEELTSQSSGPRNSDTEPLKGTRPILERAAKKPVNYAT